MQMTFEEQLRVALDALADRLREHTTRELETVVHALAEPAHAEREQALAEARASAASAAVVERDAAVATVREATERAAAEQTAAAVAEAESRAEARGREQGHAEGREHGLAEGRERGLIEGLEQGLTEGRERGLTEGREQGVAEGREEGRRDAEAAAQTAIANAEARQPIEAGIAASERLVDALRSIDRARSLSEILDTLMLGCGHEASRVAVLLVAGERFRAWRFRGFGALDDDRALEISFDEGGVMGEAARNNEPVLAELIGAPSFAVPPPRRDSFAVPIAMAGQVVAVLYTDQGASATRSTDETELFIPNRGRKNAIAEPRTRNEEPRTPNPERRTPEWAAAVEVLTRHASRCLEVLTAFKAARALMGRPEGQSGTAASADGFAAEDEAAARRYARLLVSEIKLYHEPEVVAGRRDRDLSARLGGEIARARVLYEQRVAPHVRERADYFHDELVRTLANGDASLLEMST